MGQYDVYVVALDPALGHEYRKTRPCLVVSPDEMNAHLGTVMIAPMTTKSHPYPSRVPVRFLGKSGYICLDQIRTVDKARLAKRLGAIPDETAKLVKSVIREMLVE
jgi:mRNA interferase MazF